MSAETILLVLSIAAFGQAEESTSADAAAQRRLKFLKEKVTEFTLFNDTSKQPLCLKEEPVLRYSIPERDNGTWDGALFLWLEGNRPVAAICMGIRRPNDQVVREQTSFTSQRLVCYKSGTVAWSPKSGGLLNQPFREAPAPSETAVSRLTQMRALARRFSATCYRRGDATELRLMSQPLYRFSDDKQGILDGALFGLAVSNDAEMLLLLEAVNDQATRKATWRYSLARMSSLEHKVRLDDAEIWTIPRYYDIAPDERKTGPYIEGPIGTYRPGDAP
jgi:hypothetical protein